jgi:hypothetical protein
MMHAPLTRADREIDLGKLRALYGRLHDIAFDVATLDALARETDSIPNSRDRQRHERKLAGLAETIRLDVEALASSVGAVEPRNRAISAEQVM